MLCEFLRVVPNTFLIEILTSFRFSLMLLSTDLSQTLCEWILLGQG